MKKKKKTVRRTRKSHLTKGIFAVLGFLLGRGMPFLLIAFVLGVSAWAITSYIVNDPKFILQYVRVTTDHVYPKDEVVSRGGIVTGQNIFTVDIKKIADNLRRDARLRTVRVVRQLPDTIQVDLFIRQPFALLVPPEGKYSYVVDNQGVVIEKRTDKVPPQPVYLINDENPDMRKLFPGVQYFPRGIQDLFAVIEYLKTTHEFTIANVSEFNIDKMKNITILTTAGFQIKLGNTDVLTNIQKVELIPKVLADYVNGSVVYVDLRFDGIIVKQPESRTRKK